MKSAYIAGPYTAPTLPRENANILNAAEVASKYIRQGYAVPRYKALTGKEWTDL